MTEQPVVVCAMCGARRPEDRSVTTLAWVRETEDGRTRWLCPRCAREHVRDIEGKLPVDYW